MFDTSPLPRPIKNFLPLHLISLISICLFSHCQVQEKGPNEPVVVTENPTYNRLHSHVLVRRIKLATEGYLDYAAYSKNVMLADPAWHAVHPKHKIGLKSLSFGGQIMEVKPLLDFTPLTEMEKNRPLSWTPVLEHLLKWNFEKTSTLANAYSTVTTEHWGDSSDISQPYQEFGALYIHSKGNVKEVWVELEFKPWLNSSMYDLLDQDRDGYPEAFVRLDPRIFTAEMIQEIEGDYSSKILNEAEVMDWAHNLASRWYPSYNTDLLPLTPGAVWPYTESSQAVKTELAGIWVANPLFIFKGRPFEDTLYNVFEVDSMGQSKNIQEKKKTGTPVAHAIDKGLSARLEAITTSIDAELKMNGNGNWKTWAMQVSHFQNEVKKLSQTQPADIQGLVSQNQYLIFRRELNYLLATDLLDPSQKQHPITVIAAFKDYLAKQGIDFLFVPIPTKLDIYPEIVAPQFVDSLPSHIPQPYYRKLLRDLADARVESIDLEAPFLQSKSSSENEKRKLYQKQDTHWTTTGLELAADIVANRIKNYSWFDATFSNPKQYKVKDSTFENLGDIQAQLPANNITKFAPELVLGHQVLDASGNLYQDTDSSSILILGDSYTGVFQTVGCRHAGVTAHMAKKLGGPVDLIMGWGGGPEAPSKLKARGEDYLKNKKLVVWMMSVRDIFVYSGDWSIK